MKAKTIIGLLMLLSVIYTIPTTSSARIDALSGPAFESTLVEDVPENATVLNTTNPDAFFNSGPLDERYLEEGSRPLNVLVFADEEAQLEQHWVGIGPYNIPIYVGWEDYAVFQIERGDETLVAEFGIDIRVIDTLTWDSDDSKIWFDQLTYELWYEKGVPYLRGEYNGIMIDAIIGVTAQNTDGMDTVYGQALSLLGVVLLRWEAYWVDDNLVQHEVSHLFFAEDVENEWSVMSYDYSYRDHVEEDGYWWWIFDLVLVAFLSNDYGSYNYAKINDSKDRFPIPLGDADLDGDVDMTDYDVWLDNRGITPEGWSPAFEVDPDFDNDGTVNLDDLLIWQENAMIHDVAVTSVTPSPTTVGKGESVTINVDVKNEGSFTETFDVTTYYDSTAISTQTVTVAFQDSTTLTFNWNTLGAPDGTYTIKAVASTVSGETDTVDNTYVDGTVKVEDHDIAITDVNRYPASVRAGESVLIDVLAENDGCYTETFDVTIYYDSTAIETRTVTDLAPGRSEYLMFHWDTTGVAEGTYTISAYATPVPGETNTMFNTYVDGTVEIYGDHDVAVTDVAPVLPYGATAVYPSWVIDVSVTVRNEGDFSETFTVTAYYDSAAIGTQTVSNLTPNATMTLTFIWDTTGVSPGNAGLNYTISAEASVVPDETDTADNTYVDGTVRVKYPGDVDGDGDVDRYDSGALSAAYGSYYGDPNYDWRCDFNGDGDVDRYDSSILARNYGHQP